MSLPAGGKPKLRGLEHRTDRIALRNQLARRRRGVGGGHSVTCLWGPIQPILDIGDFFTPPSLLHREDDTTYASLVLQTCMVCPSCGAVECKRTLHETRGT